MMMDALVKASINYFTLEGERIQNCQNEDEALDVTYSCARVRNKVTVIWELAPIEPRREYSSSSSSLFGGGGGGSSGGLFGATGNGGGNALQQANHSSGSSTGIPVPLPRAPLRLVCVIDVSHSMEEPYGNEDNISKLDKVKLFAKLLVGNMPEEDDLGIVTFGTYAQTAFPLTAMSIEAKEDANKAIDGIQLGGVTNLGAGLCTAIDLFRNIYSKSRYLNDHILLFTDGMANEGITETDDMVRELRKRIAAIRTDCQFAQDYSVKISTMGTGGFLPELLFNVGQAFSSDAFYFLEEHTSLELNLMKPVLLSDAALVTAVSCKLETLNGVRLEKTEMTNEYEPYDPDDENDDDTTADYFINDIALDMKRHLVCVLHLPPKAKKVLKNKDVMTLSIQYRDRNLMVRTVEKTVSFIELPNKEALTLEKDVVIAAEHECRTMAQKTLDHASEFMKRLDRSTARRAMMQGITYIREHIEYVSALMSEETHEYITHRIEPILVNLEYCEGWLGDLAVRWDDAWARLKAISSSLGREVPTASGVYAEGAELFVPTVIDERLEGLMTCLRSMYIALGLSTDMIDRYKTVMQELAAKLERLEEEGTDFKETRI